MSTNSKVLKDGFAKVESIMREAMRDRCVESGMRILKHAVAKRGWKAFTGQTITSYAFGCFENGKLFEIYITGEDMKNPIRAKIEKGKTIFLSNPYEGAPRNVTGKVDILNDSGRAFSFDFIQSYRPKNTTGFSIVITTGTEYSEYLENVRKLNTLTDTFQEVKTGLVSDIFSRPIQ